MSANCADDLADANSDLKTSLTVAMAGFCSAASGTGVFAAPQAVPHTNNAASTHDLNWLRITAGLRIGWREVAARIVSRRLRQPAKLSKSTEKKSVPSRRSFPVQPSDGATCLTRLMTARTFRLLGDRQMKTYQYKPDAQASVFLVLAEQ